MNKAKSGKSNKRGRGFRVAVIIILAILALLAAALAFRMAYRGVVGSSHKIGEPGIDTAEMVDIGGIKQYINIRGENKDNPVMLFLHGGPGSPMTALLHGFQYAWEKDFTIVQWDQRSAGKTFFANDREAVLQTMTFDRMLQDAKEVSDYVRNKLGKDKIVVLGHSWGTILGSALVQAYPDDFIAYIGVGQVVNMVENERVGYEATLAAARNDGNSKDIEALEKLSGYPGTDYNAQTYANIGIVRKYQSKYGLALSINAEIVFLGLTSPYYSLGDVRYYMTDLRKYQDPILRYMFEEYDIHNYGTDYSIPVYYIMGENDFQTPITLASEFFEEINSPEKRFFEIDGAAHFTMMDNRAGFNSALSEIRLSL